MLKDMETLLWGAGSTIRLNASEQRLLEFALDTFDLPLGRFLVSGLGEQSGASGWSFTVKFSTCTAIINRKIRVEFDDLSARSGRNPNGREPLVILALLWLLLERCEASGNTLSYQQEEVLSLLDWRNIESSRRAIDKTLRRYMGLDYRWSLGKEELTGGKLLYFHGSSRFISGYGCNMVKMDGEVEPFANEVYFQSEFIKGLMERSLFDLNWNSVHKISRRIIG